MSLLDKLYLNILQQKILWLSLAIVSIWISAKKKDKTKSQSARKHTLWAVITFEIVWIRFTHLGCIGLCWTVLMNYKPLCPYLGWKYKSFFRAWLICYHVLSECDPDSWSLIPIIDPNPDAHSLGGTNVLSSFVWMWSWTLILDPWSRSLILIQIAHSLDPWSWSLCECDTFSLGPCSKSSVEDEVYKAIHSW